MFYLSDLILFCLLLVILGIFIFISGYGKAFINFFSTKKSFEKLEIKNLNEVEKSIIYACKVAAYEAIFFVGIGTVYYYVNWIFIEAQDSKPKDKKSDPFSQLSARPHAFPCLIIFANTTFICYDIKNVY